MIDHDRLIICLLNDISENLHNNYDFDRIVSSAFENEEGNIVVEVIPDFRFVYDGVTYVQLEGQGLNDDLGV